MAGGPSPTFLEKLKFRPGINQESTFYANAGGYWDSNRVRFRGIYPETIGGWQKDTSSAFLGSCRALISWIDLSGNLFYGMGTHLKYYVRLSGTNYDITPIRETQVLALNPFASTNGSTTVTVTDPAHGAVLNDFVTFSAATTFAGIPAIELNAEHQVSNITVNTYTFQVTTPATSTTSGGGTPTAVYQINVGLDSVILGAGWGAGAWGSGGWGLAASVFAASGQLRIWSHDTWGEDLIINPRDSGIYYWDRSTGTSSRAVDLSTLGGASDTPVIASQMLVSGSDRHVFAFGTNPIGSAVQDRLFLRWSDQEDVANWTPSISTTSGDLRIGVGSQILKAIRTRQELLVWTDISLHSIQYLGPPFQFGMQTLSSNTNLIGPNGVIDTGEVVVWMGTDNFFFYSGRVEPLPCTLQQAVFSDLNLNQTWKVYCNTNKRFNEVTWFYPSADSEECNKYITFQYADKLWYGGDMTRTAWLDHAALTYPIAAGTDKFLYIHEIGTKDGEFDEPTCIESFITTSPVELGSGDNFMLVRRMVPDITFERSTAVTPSILVEINGYAYPGGTYEPAVDGSITKATSVLLERFTNSVPMRIRARMISFRYSCEQPEVAWRIGDMRMELRPDGKR